MTHLAQGTDAPRPRRPGRLLAAPALLALVTVACSPAAPTGAPTSPSTSGGPSAGPSGGPSDGPSAAPTTGAIPHPTGAKDVVLRMEEVGGFAPIELSATYTPSFTLYGDGTVIWRDNQAPPPESSDNLIRTTALMTVKLDEAQVQALLDDAIGPGGLGIATGPYNEMAGADIPSTVFTINAGDLREPKVVDVVGMSPDMHPQNVQVINALIGLAEKLRTFDTLVDAQPYAPSAWRGVLIPTDQAFGPVVDWPWKDVEPADFGGDNEFFRINDLTSEQVAAIGIDDLAGGVSGFVLQDGEDLYSFAVRPLLPDELQDAPE
jgi:hypothetical protein